MNASEWASVVNRTVEAQIERLVALAPNLAAAALIILVGWLLAILARAIVRRIVGVIVEKLSQRSRELPAPDCVPQDAQIHEHFDADRLTSMVK